jgi:hypothetical protein
LRKTQRHNMRELIDAELDVVGGGTMQIFAREPKPTGGIKLAERIIVGILRLLEPKQSKPVSDARNIHF